MVDIIEPGPDEELSEHRCVPILEVGMKVNMNVGVPDVRAELESDVKEHLRYVERNVYSTLRDGAAVHENIKFIVEIPTAETWDSINRKVQSLKEWAEEEDIVERVGRDVSITLDAGDPEAIIREEEEGFRR